MYAFGVLARRLAHTSLEFWVRASKRGPSLAAMCVSISGERTALAMDNLASPVRPIHRAAQACACRLCCRAPAGLACPHPTRIGRRLRTPLPSGLARRPQPLGPRSDQGASSKFDLPAAVVVAAPPDADYNVFFYLVALFAFTNIIISHHCVVTVTSVSPAPFVSHRGILSENHRLSPMRISLSSVLLGLPLWTSLSACYRS